MVQTPFAVMRSRINGRMQVYALTEQLATCERFEADMNVLKSRVQAELDANGVDAQVEECKQIVSRVYDYLIVKTWAPAESPVLPAIVLFIIKAVVVVATWAAIVVVTYLGALGFKEVLFPTPKYYCSVCGAGPFGTVAELTAHRTTAHPEVAQYQCPYCGQAFQTVEQLNAHVAECPWKPPEVPPWVPYLIVAVVAVGAIIIIPKILDLIKKK